MTWAKTDAGRAALISGAGISDQTQRSALRAVDGRTSQAALITSLLSSVPGISDECFEALFARGLIAPVVALAASRSAPAKTARAAPTAIGGVERRGAQRLSSSPMLAYGELSAELTRFISSELGVRGLTLMLALERAATVGELQKVRQAAITRARHKGQSRVSAVSPRFAPRARA